MGGLPGLSAPVLHPRVLPARHSSRRPQWIFLPGWGAMLGASAPGLRCGATAPRVAATGSPSPTFPGPVPSAPPPREVGWGGLRGLGPQPPPWPRPRVSIAILSARTSEPAPPRAEQYTAGPGAGRGRAGGGESAGGGGAGQAHRPGSSRPPGSARRGAAQPAPGTQPPPRAGPAPLPTPVRPSPRRSRLELPGAAAAAG